MSGLPLWASVLSCMGAGGEREQPVGGPLGPKRSCLLGLLHHVIFVPSPTIFAAVRRRLPSALRGVGRLDTSLPGSPQHRTQRVAGGDA
jgi:hypothetical protein